MVALIAHYEVTDLARFIEVFEGFEPTRRESGAVGHRVLSSRERPEALIVVIEFASSEAATAFARSQERADALERAGVLRSSDEIYEELAS